MPDDYTPLTPRDITRLMFDLRDWLLARYQGHTISVRKSPNGFRVASRPWPEVIGPSRKRKRDLASPPTIDTPEAKSCNCPPRVTQAGGAQSGRLRVGKADDGSPRM